ncbi:DUF2156 domain-containing protein [Patescibacteria group bacterium]|nr:DUF2156 domain-containing protein [Patescibacteria group bacterium]MBU1727982.1 DUF2156 domain-containing protein [Patescibacteria group bacterium]
MIPEFPKFKKLELSDKEDIEKFTCKFPPYSDFSFISMWSWDIKNEMQVSQLNNNLVVRFTDYLTGKPFYSFLGNNKINETAEALINLSKKEGLKPELKLVPEDSIRNLDKKKFTTKEENDHFDYIYSTEGISSYGSPRNKKNRQLVRYFNKMHKFEIHNLDLTDAKKQRLLLDLIELWTKNKKDKVGLAEDYTELEDLRNESVAFKRFLSVPDYFLKSLICLSLFIDGDLSGFIIGEKISKDYCLAHFGKADIKYKGISQFLMQQNAKFFWDLGVIYHNDEQDLGLQKLRFSKNSYELAHFLKKYTIALIDDSVI